MSVISLINSFTCSEYFRCCWWPIQHYISSVSVCSVVSFFFFFFFLFRPLSKCYWNNIIITNKLFPNFLWSFFVGFLYAFWQITICPFNIKNIFIVVLFHIMETVYSEFELPKFIGQLLDIMFRKLRYWYIDASCKNSNWLQKA